MTNPAAPTPSGRSMLVARVLMTLAAAAALASGLGSISTVVDAASGVRVVETWRMLGLVFFGGVFALLALQPRAYRGLWEITLLNKVLLTGLAIGYGVAGTATEAWTTAVADGSLTLFLVVSYILVRGWRPAGA